LAAIVGAARTRAALMGLSLKRGDLEMNLEASLAKRIAPVAPTPARRAFLLISSTSLGSS